MALAAREYVLSGEQIPDFDTATNVNPPLIVPVDSELLGVYAHNNVVIDPGGGTPCIFLINKNTVSTTFSFRIEDGVADETVAFYPLTGKVFFVAGDACQAISDGAQTSAGDLHVSFLFRRL